MVVEVAEGDDLDRIDSGGSAGQFVAAYVSGWINRRQGGHGGLRDRGARRCRLRTVGKQRELSRAQGQQRRSWAGREKVWQVTSGGLQT